jgi:hypothetical protein
MMFEVQEFLVLVAEEHAAEEQDLDYEQEQVLHLETQKQIGEMV